ncbi:MAG TPA: hypothetical protein VK633_10475 [Verrucomicrobiae bacterium]|nr:hypothetical protein [Verrucomicrobiae bacterium]
MIPTLPVLLTLLLGALRRSSSYFDLAKKTKRRHWRRLIHWDQPISHDTLSYVCECFYLEDLRAVLVALNQTLKANKNLESCKINGLLFLSVDANEHCASRSRCCEQCSQREIEARDGAGQVSKVIEYYHRYVFAEINGPKMNFLLDLEPIRPGEEEAGRPCACLGGCGGITECGSSTRSPSMPGTSKAPSCAR